MQAKIEAYSEELDRDSNVIMIGEDIGEMGGITGQCPGFLAKYGPDRILSATLAESCQASFAVGAAAAGAKAIVEYMCADFAAYAWDGMVNQAAKQRYISGGQWTFPTVFLLPQGVGYGIGAHHSTCIEGWFQNCPGIKVYVPTFPADYKGLMKHAIRDEDPVAFLEGKAVTLEGEVPDLDVDHILEPGQANVLVPGTDVTIVSYQGGLLNSLKAIETLTAEGISCEVIDIRTVVPLDEKTILESVRKTGRILVVTESPKKGGFGNQIATLAAEKAFDSLKSPVRYIGGKDAPIPFGIVQEQMVVPQAADIIEAVKEMVK